MPLPSYLMLTITCVFLFIVGHSGIYAADMIVNDDAAPSFDIGFFADYLEDAGSDLTIDDLIRGESEWLPLNQQQMNSGYSHSAFWMRVKLINSGSEIQRYYLDIGSSLTDYVSVYIVVENAVEKSFVMGDRLPFASRPLGARSFVVPLDVIVTKPMWIYIRFSSYDGLHEISTPRLLSPIVFTEKLQFETLSLGVYQGVLLSILLYNLFLLIATRDKRFLLYCLYLTMFSFWGFVFRGYAFQYFWPDHPDFNNQILPISVCLSYVTFVLFSIVYLDMRRSVTTWLYQANIAVIVLNLLTLIPAVSGYYLYSFAISVPSGILLLIISVGTGVWLMIKGSRPARYFMSAFGVLAYYLQLLGLVHSNVVTEYGIQIGSCLEVLLLAFGLADQMNTLKAEKLKTEQMARVAQNKFSEKLTQQVKERTAELEIANHQLERLAIVDDLTGAYNRRHFNQIFEKKISSHQRMKVPLAFCMIDIDNAMLNFQ